MPQPAPVIRIPGIRKAAILVVLLGDKAAGEIYRQLNQEQVESLTREIAEVDYIPRDLAIQVLEEFDKLALTRDYLAKGGLEYAEKLLVSAFGEIAAKELLNQVMRSQEVSLKDLDVLQKADPQQLAKLVEGEHSQTVALLLAHLGAKSSSAMLQLLPEKRRAEVVERLAKLRQFSPEMVQKIISVLHRKIQGLGKQNRLAYGGIDAVADLLNRMDSEASKTILETIEQQDPNLALSIRNVMFTFEDLIGVPEAAIREIVSQVDKKNLALALKRATAELKAHMCKVMSSRAVEMLTEDMDAMGPVRARDVSAAQQEIVALARKLESEGKLTLKNEVEDAYVV